MWITIFVTQPPLVLKEKENKSLKTDRQERHYSIKPVHTVVLCTELTRVSAVSCYLTTFPTTISIINIKFITLGSKNFQQFRARALIF